MAIFPYGYRGPSRWRRVRRGAAALALVAALLVPGPGGPDAAEPASTSTGSVRLTLKVVRPPVKTHVKHEECNFSIVVSDSCAKQNTINFPHRIERFAGSSAGPAEALIRPE